MSLQKFFKQMIGSEPIPKIKIDPNLNPLTGLEDTIIEVEYLVHMIINTTSPHISAFVRQELLEFRQFLSTQSALLFPGLQLKRVKESYCPNSIHTSYCGFRLYLPILHYQLVWTKTLNFEGQLNEQMRLTIEGLATNIKQLVDNIPAELLPMSDVIDGHLNTILQILEDIPGPNEQFGAQE